MLYFARWKIVVILAICVLGLVYASPNFWRSDNLGTNLPSWIPHKTVNLGLDLQGGAHLLIEVQTSAVLKERLEAVEDNVRRSLRDARVGYRGLGVRGNAVVFTLREAGDADRARQLVAERDGLVTVEIDDSGAARLAYPQEVVVDVESAAVEQTLEILRIRLNELGLREPTIQRHGADRIIVQLPGVDDPDTIKELLTQTAKLTFHLLDQRNADPAAAAPPGARWHKGTDPFGQVIDYLVEKRVRVSGERLVDAQQTFQDGQPVVSFRFDSVGARQFGRTTGEHVGRPLAIVLDNEVISAPRINEPILGGSGIISGSFTLTEAQNLALLLRAGALPAPLIYLEERTVGPGLGQDSIDAGKAASIIGMVAVLVFMVVVYGLFGVMANIALVFNMALIFGALSLLQATLTPSRHRRHRADHRHGGGRERADLRAHPRGSARGARRHRGHRRRLRPGAQDHHRRKPHDPDCRGSPVLVRLRAGQGLRRHAGHRHHDLHVHRDLGHETDGRPVGSPPAPANVADLRGGQERCDRYG